MQRQTPLTKTDTKCNYRIILPKATPNSKRKNHNPWESTIFKTSNASNHLCLGVRTLSDWPITNTISSHFRTGFVIIFLFFLPIWTWFWRIVCGHWGILRFLLPVFARINWVWLRLIANRNWRRRLISLKTMVHLSGSQSKISLRNKRF